MKSGTSGSRRLPARLCADTHGGTPVEYAIALALVLLLVVGSIEMGLALGQWNTAPKATQYGARAAAVLNPVAAGLNTTRAPVTANVKYGDLCQNPATGVSVDIPECRLAADPVTCAAGGCNGYVFDPAAFAAVVTQLQRVMPQIRPENVVVEYRSSGLGFVGRPGGNPVLITVRLRGMTVQFSALGFLLNLVGTLVGKTNVDLSAGVPLPAFAATILSEDLNTAPPAF